MYRRKAVLLLDFDSDLLIALERLLEDSGFNCTSTWNVEQAYALMESGAFEFLVIGHRPPELDAHEILADLRLAGMRFGSFILGNLVREDGFGNLIDQLRRFPCELSSETKQPAAKPEFGEPAEQVMHGR
jgi:CheY-like chemotaxis protein